MEVIIALLTIFGGLAMFLYGMRIMGNNLKESSSGTLKVFMERVTNNPVKAFLLGLIITGIIQSSTACIVITAGLVVAGIIKFEHSIGIIVGANVGTTVTGQIISLIGIGDESNSILRFFKPEILAPVSLIAGIIILMSVNTKNSENIGTIIIGFGILFSGLVAMTDAVTQFQSSLESLFTTLGKIPILGYLCGFIVSFILQSSSASVGILQSFSLSGALTFNSVYVIICGIFLGDCLTTAIVCFIGAKAESKRVGFVNVVFNLCKTLLVLVFVNLFHSLGWWLTDDVWFGKIGPSGIANANTIFNLACAIVLLPFLSLFVKLGNRIIKDDKERASMFSDEVEELSPNFFSTPALAFRSCYDVLMKMFMIAKVNINRSQDLLKEFNSKTFDIIKTDERRLDYITDKLSNYLIQLSQHVNGIEHTKILDQYYKMVTEFERLGDHAVNIAESAKTLYDNHVSFTDTAKEELVILRDLLDEILSYTQTAFEKRDIECARRIEPLEEVMDDLINALHENHLQRLRENQCTIIAGTCFLDVLSNVERISDTCSNVGVATVARVDAKVARSSHKYISALHQGKNIEFNRIYHEKHDIYFDRLPYDAKSLDDDQQSFYDNEYIQNEGTT